MYLELFLLLIGQYDTRYVLNAREEVVQGMNRCVYITASRRYYPDGGVVNEDAGLFQSAEVCIDFFLVLDGRGWDLGDEVVVAELQGLEIF